LFSFFSFLPIKAFWIDFIIVRQPFIYYVSEETACRNIGIDNSNLYKRKVVKYYGDPMKKLVALSFCFLFLGCIVGIKLDTPEDAVTSWVKSFNDRDVKGMYLTLSEEYIVANGGEEKVREDIRIMLEYAADQNTSYVIKSIGRLAIFRDEYLGEDIFLVRIDREYVENDEKKVEEIILNFKVVEENKKYKIVDVWD
jgi:hypothetical protein